MGISTPAAIRSSVVLPAPLGPPSHATVPGSTTRSAPLRTSRSPHEWATPARASEGSGRDSATAAGSHSGSRGRVAPVAVITRRSNEFRPRLLSGPAVLERELVGDLAQTRGARVARGGEEPADRQRPLDRHVRIVEGEAALDLPGVVVALLVDDVGVLGEHAEAVGEADRAVEDPHVLVAQLERLPLAERWRSAPDVDQHVYDRSPGAAHELRGAATDLEVHPPDDPPPRARVVVLDQLLNDPQLREHVLSVGLAEEPPVVPVHHGFDQHRSLQSSLQPAHVPPGLGLPAQRTRTRRRALPAAGLRKPDGARSVS